MCGFLRRYEFNAFVSQSPQVNPFEQRFPPAEQDRRDSNVQFINEALTKILAGLCPAHRRSARPFRQRPRVHGRAPRECLLL